MMILALICLVIMATAAWGAAHSLWNIILILVERRRTGCIPDLERLG